jgi:hypothetical protein
VIDMLKKLSRAFVFAVLVLSGAAFAGGGDPGNGDGTDSLPPPAVVALR